MSFLICIPDRDISRLVEQLSARIGGDVIRIWPDVGDAADIEFVLAWNPPPSLWAQLPNLKAVMSYGAGVDGLALAALPPHVAVSRVVDPKLAEDMAEYVLAQVLYYKQRAGFYLDRQREEIWKPRRALQGARVGILGLGKIGTVVAGRLRANGFSVSAWSRNPKVVEGIDCYSGDIGLAAMLPDVDYLVCLLPLTDETRGILNKRLFDAMAEHAILINVGRGDHLVESELLDALKAGQIAAACLDVFSTEPLPQGHPFWLHPAIRITPHCAALTDIDTVVDQIETNYRLQELGKKVINQIDRTQNY